MCLHFRENTGGITFGDFMNFLSTLSKGTLQEKIYWSFRFYDVNKDGIISRDEMIKVRIHDMSSPSPYFAKILFITPAERPLRIFEHFQIKYFEGSFSR